MKRLPRFIARVLEEARDAAALKRCGVPEEHQKAMKLYLDTWVVARLERVLSWHLGHLDRYDFDETEGY